MSKDPPQLRRTNDVAASDLWIFGYGSLMWRPGFDFEESCLARVTGFNRRFCVYSFHHRGTARRPGLVLGLDRGGTCDGVAYRIAPQNRKNVLIYLREREQVSGVYREMLCRALLLDSSGRQVKALAYIVERAHPQYAPALPLHLQAQIIRGASGISGVNLDYLLSTVSHLRELGIRERNLERICALAGPHLASPTHSDCSLSPVNARSQARTKAMTNAQKQAPSPVRRLEESPYMRFAYRRCWGTVS